jgi:hypothetical protein
MTEVAVMDELDLLLDEVGRRGFTWHQFRVNHHGPEVLAGVLRRPSCVDVLVLTGPDTAHAYRIPADAETDIFAPQQVLWWYAGNSPVWTARAILALPSPDDRNAPKTRLRAPAVLRLHGSRAPVRVRKRIS